MWFSSIALLAFQAHATAAFQAGLSPLFLTRPNTNTASSPLPNKSIPCLRAARDQANDEKRRRTLFDIAAANSLPFFANKKNANAVSGVTTSSEKGGLEPIADFPMRRLRLPKGGMGREYIVLQLYIQNTGPYDFMVDSGLTTELITPHLQEMLHLRNSAITKQGLSAGQTGQTQSLVELRDVSLCCNGAGKDGKEERFPLPSPLFAVVTDFPQEHMDPAHDPVEGMLGMELLEQFDVDLDFPNQRLRLWKPGTVREVAEKVEGMVAIDAVVVNETKLLGFRVAPASSVVGADGKEGVSTQPYLGLVDCGSSFSIVNWAAATLLGLPPQSDRKAYEKNPMVSGMGVDGRPQLFPTYNVQLSYCGNPIQSSSKSILTFQPPPLNWKPWDPISIAIGDLPVFSQLLGDGKTPYKGPAGIIGLDILSQRHVILETSAGRKRRIYVGTC
ncbi:hypothetical protein ACHAW6_012949 [Cyclotella cf. meneghiniana]